MRCNAAAVLLATQFCTDNSWLEQGLVQCTVGSSEARGSGSDGLLGLNRCGGEGRRPVARASTASVARWKTALLAPALYCRGKAERQWIAAVGVGCCCQRRFVY